MAVFIDGRNLHRRLKDEGWPTNVDVLGFARRLAGGRHLVAVHYYNVPPPSVYPRHKIRAQERYYSRVRALSGVIFHLGHLQERNVGTELVFEEKGVDIEIASDMITGAYDNLYDTAILVSTDGDFAPAVRAVRRKGKKVENLYFPSRKSRALQRAGCLMRLCRKAWIIELRTLKIG